MEIIRSAHVPMLKIEELKVKMESNSFGKTIKAIVPISIMLPEIIIEYLRVSVTRLLFLAP